jgi:hypothetical protein
VLFQFLQSLLGRSETYRIVIPTKTAIRNNTDEDTYEEFQKLTVNALGLTGSIDTSALKDKARFYYQSPLEAVPVVVKADRVMDISNIENKAIQNVTQARAVKEAQRLKMEQIRADIKKYRIVSMPTSNNLTYVDAEELMDVPITMLIHKFEGGEEATEGSYKYIKTDATKYSIIDDKLAHDFKNDVTYNSPSLAFTASAFFCASIALFDLRVSTTLPLSMPISFKLIC